MVTLDASLYSKSTRNQIFDVEISGASGSDRKWVNAGEISNKGIEALLTVNPIQSTDGLNWSTTFNYGRNRSRVVELAPDVETIVLGTGGFGDVLVEARVGEPYGQFAAQYMRDAKEHFTTLVVRYEDLSRCWANTAERTAAGATDQLRQFSGTLIEIRRGVNSTRYQYVANCRSAGELAART